MLKAIRRFRFRKPVGSGTLGGHLVGKRESEAGIVGSQMHRSFDSHPNERNARSSGTPAAFPALTPRKKPRAGSRAPTHQGKRGPDGDPGTRAGPSLAQDDMYMGTRWFREGV
jgi:hypothetical protein